jgi:limonene-1,2-epoxide hydrolase
LGLGEIDAMAQPNAKLNRRRFLAASSGLAAVAAFAGPAEAAETTADERANVKVVNDFCAAWPSHDLAKVMAFFSDNGAYRMTETMEPAKGKDAVTARVKSIIDRVEKFEVLDTFARGPMVINERIDRFSGGPLKAWHGVGVFFLKDGKIVEWYDYTISMDRG